MMVPMRRHPMHEHAAGLVTLALALLLGVQPGVGSEPANAAEVMGPRGSGAGDPEAPAVRADSAVAYEAGGVEGDLFVHERFSSIILGERRIFVFLPSEYAMFDERRYPVLYALDGQNYFDPEIAAGGAEWALDELLVRHPQGVPEMLVVAIPAGAQSVREYSPPGSAPGARGADTVRFLTDELKPFIDATYRTRSAAASTFIVGQGSSAVLALYAAWIRGNVFGGAIALDFPDVDAETVGWTKRPPAHGRPWLWLEQSWSERSRVSTTELVAALQRHADTRVVVTRADTPRASRILAALRAIPMR